MDNQPTISEIVCEAVLNNHAVKKAGKVQEIEPSMVLDDLKVDSLEKLALAMDFEEQFSIEITDEEIESFLTVGDFIRYLEEAVVQPDEDTPQTSQVELSDDSAAPEQASLTAEDLSTEQ